MKYYNLRIPDFVLEVLTCSGNHYLHYTTPFCLPHENKLILYAHQSTLRMGGCANIKPKVSLSDAICSVFAYRNILIAYLSTKISNNV